MNPWLSIWLQPRATMRGILASDSQQDLLWMTIVIGIYLGFGMMPQFVWLSPPPENVIAAGSRWILAVSIPLLGAVSMLFSVYVGSYVIRWAGTWLGGQAAIPQIRAAMVWGSIPSAMANALGGIVDILSPKALGPDSTIMVMLGVLLSIIVLGLFIWATIVSCKCLAEAQGFGAWRAFFNYAIGGGIITALIFLPLLVLVMFMAG